MYLGEFVLWLSSSLKASTRQKMKMGYLNDEMLLSEVQKDYTKISVSNTPRPLGPYYAYNQRYLEIRGGMLENFRGIITWISLIFFLLAGYINFSFLRVVYNLIFPESYPFAIGFSFYFGLVFLLIISVIINYLLFRYFRYFYRLELFTLRHIRVRFNRITQQVYIQRPKYCGGTVVFKWQDIMPANFGEEGSDMDGTNMVNLLSFHPYKTGFPVAQSIGIGKNTYNAQDYKDEWEFIRRYMEHGPAELPKPRISTHLPLPFHGLEGHFKPIWHLWKTHQTFFYLIMLIPVTVIILPLYTIGYFISECLCWQPRWPKIIRQAGLPGKPTPAETTLSDYPVDVQQSILDCRLEWRVKDDKTGQPVDYGND